MSCGTTSVLAGKTYLPAGLMGCETGRLKHGMAAKGKEMTATVKHDDWLFEQLKDAEFAAEFINAASEDDDPKSYLTALRKVVEARGGMAGHLSIRQPEFQIYPLRVTIQPIKIIGP